MHISIRWFENVREKQIAGNYDISRQRKMLSKCSFLANLGNQKLILVQRKIIYAFNSPFLKVMLKKEIFDHKIDKTERRFKK